MGEGEIGVRGIGPGDRSESTGRGALAVAEMLRDNLGLAVRAAYILKLTGFFSFFLSKAKR
jgi:hypothetical protein